jgi:hypothetical protein
VRTAVFELIELEDGHQLNAINAQILEIRDFLADAGESAWMLDARGRVPCETADVRLIDYQVLDRYF